ncbi:MAG: EamA family transporter [Sphingorhabdus sp.]
MGVATGIALAGLSALTTASAHATVKSGQSKLAVRAWVSIIQCGLCLPVALWLGLPSHDLLPWLAAAWALHVVYQLMIIQSYNLTDFSVAFPIARGIAPIATVGFAALILGEELAIATLFGVAAVSIGIVILGMGSPLASTALLAAIGAGVLTALYTVVDTQGVRIAETALHFIAWFFVLDVFGMPLLLIVTKGREAIIMLRRDWAPGVPAALLSLLSFGAALFALDFAPAAVVASIRETSIGLGLIIGAVILKEEVGWMKIVGGTVVAIGAALVALTA